MNRLVLVFRLPQAAICPVCGETLRSEAATIRDGYAVCGPCDECMEHWGGADLLAAVRRLNLPGVWSRQHDVMFLCPNRIYLSRISPLLQLRCGLWDHPAAYQFGDGEGI